MIFSENNTLIVRLEELKMFLLKQNYPPFLIDDSISKLKDLNRPDLPSRKHLRTKVTPDLHQTYSKNGGNLGLKSQ